MTAGRWAVVAAVLSLALVPASAYAQASGSAPADRSLDFKGAAIVGVERFTAVKTFQGIFGGANGTIYGGGVDVRIQRHWFGRLDVTRFARTGQRAFALNGHVSRLGIPLDVSIVPVTGTFGYRAAVSPRIGWYVGAGIGSWGYHESGPDPTDTVSLRGTGYLGLAGVEWKLHRFVAIGFEGQFAGVPGAIGKAGLSADLHESDLGGIGGALRIVVGR
jgi:outer membrane protein with beta-barrel domain